MKKDTPSPSPTSIPSQRFADTPRKYSPSSTLKNKQTNKQRNKCCYMCFYLDTKTDAKLNKITALSLSLSLGTFLVCS